VWTVLMWLMTVTGGGVLQTWNWTFRLHKRREENSLTSWTIVSSTYLLVMYNIYIYNGQYWLLRNCPDQRMVGEKTKRAWLSGVDPFYLYPSSRWTPLQTLSSQHGAHHFTFLFLPFRFTTGTAFVFHKRRRISWVAERLPASQQWLYSTELLINRLPNNVVNRKILTWNNAKRLFVLTAVCRLRII
jgi:hypothetical protein